MQNIYIDQLYNLTNRRITNYLQHKKSWVRKRILEIKNSWVLIKFYQNSLIFLHWEKKLLIWRNRAITFLIEIFKYLS